MLSMMMMIIIKILALMEGNPFEIRAANALIRRFDGEKVWPR